MRIRDGTEYEEVIGVKRHFIHELKGHVPKCVGVNENPVYYDLAILELGNKLGSAALRVKPRYANAQNCLGPTLGTWWNAEVSFDTHSLPFPFLIRYCV